MTREQRAREVLDTTLKDADHQLKLFSSSWDLLAKAILTFADQELERAAEKCDEIRGTMDELTGRGAVHAARAIRAMKDQQ